MKEYRGFRDAGGQVHVLVIDERRGQHPLPHFVRHSPSGFEWGYSGSGPADLARSILAEHLGGHIAPVPRIYQLFKFTVIARLPREAWTLTHDEVALWLEGALRELELTCPRCGDQGVLWPEQQQRPADHAGHASTPCDCEAGELVRHIGQEHTNE